ncbi:hypothetical protein D3C80_2240250 [compost metagenome]
MNFLATTSWVVANELAITFTKGSRQARAIMTSKELFTTVNIRLLAVCFLKDADAMR